MLSEGIEFGGVDEEADLVLKDEAGRLYELVDDLDARSREIITLRYGEDLSIPEISEMLGISENNASVRLHRALKKLEEKTNEIN